MRKKMRVAMFLAVLLLCSFVILSRSKNGFAFTLPDTGQTKCYGTSGTEISCTGTGQDGAYNIHPMSYTDNGNGTITDNVTGLIWQKGENSSSGYNWYQASGTYNEMDNPSSQNVCGSLTLGGYSDWRLPTKKELITIVDYGIPYPGQTINTTYFPNTYANDYWSSTTYASGTISAWVVTFDSGFVGSYGKSFNDYVRCVRGGQSGASSQNNCGATLSGSFLLHEPYFTINGSSLFIDLQYAQNAQFPSTDIMFKLSNYGGMTNPSIYSSCQASTWMAIGTNYVLHIPIVILGGTSYWLDLTYMPTTDGLLWFKLTNFGLN